MSMLRFCSIISLFASMIFMSVPLYSDSAQSNKNRDETQGEEALMPPDTVSKKIPERSQDKTRKQGEENAAGKLADKPSEQDIYQWFKTYAEVVSIVEKKAFRMVDFSKFIQGSLKAAAAEIDAHSAFLSQDSYKSAMESTSGEFSGIGVSILSKAQEDDALVIIDVIAGGPAAKAGLKNGDKIVEADGNKFKGLSTDEAINKLKGKPGTMFSVKVLRNKKPLEFKVTRDIIKDQTSISFVFKDFNVYYLSLKMFTENAAQQVADLLRIANDGKSRGLILDLRRNPGGTLQSAIEMSGLFVKKNSLVAVTKDKDRKVVDRYFTTTDPLLKTDVPIFILIDNFTASAAEILAGALRYHSAKSYEKKEKSQHNLLVFLVGTSTFGKGSVQEVIPISNGCALKLTTMLYYLPDDLSLQATGIEPDFLINPKYTPTGEMRWIIDMYGKESSLKRHITVKEATGKDDARDKEKKPALLTPDEENGLDIELTGDDQAKKGLSGDSEEDDTPEKWEEKQKKSLGQDVQVQAALNLINLLHLGRKCDHKAVHTRQQALTFLKRNYVTDDTVQVEKIK